MIWVRGSSNCRSLFVPRSWSAPWLIPWPQVRPPHLGRRHAPRPLRSTQKRPFFAFGHNFVVFSLPVALPFAPHKYWAFPILVRMYRERQTYQRAPGKR
jgi:hypothetical protein